eukprot:TRINITY_DN6720_c0_g1_i4.p1 TRINITY_DN6720_c0_g1~~TRINITY_DN6720_c0_g1_i4.p1  ORF type:complete len:103 (+),score=9.88 TRINITY_DN6720_c0_g1_i4:342-650(+)
MCTSLGDHYCLLSLFFTCFSTLIYIQCQLMGPFMYYIAVSIFFTPHPYTRTNTAINTHYYVCLLYTSDAADEEDSVDLGGRRIIKKKKNKKNTYRTLMNIEK